MERPTCGKVKGCRLQFTGVFHCVIGSPETAPTPVERLGIIDEEVRAGACARYQAEACARCNSHVHLHNTQIHTTCVHNIHMHSQIRHRWR